MKKSFHLSIIFLFILAPCSLLLPLPKAHAQKATPAQLLVTPSIVRLDLAVNKPQTTLTYKNLTNNTIELSFEAQDFSELNDGYQFSFLSPKDANNYSFSLSSWVHFSSKTLLLDPHSSGTVTLFIDSNKLSPGGHYATILAHLNPSSANSSQIGVQGVLGSLLFVRTHTGKEKEMASLASFDIVRNFWNFPDTATFRFINSGDTDLTPYGLVQILGADNTIVAKGIVNQTSAPTLPENIKRYYVPLRNLQPFLLPGMYHATLTLHYGQTNQKINQTITFFSQGSVSVIPIGMIVLLGLLFFFWKRRKSHKGE